MYKPGDIRRFDISRSKLPYTCKEVIPNTKLPFEWKTEFGNCPHCKKKISKVKQYTLTNVYIFENDEDRIYLADTEDKKLMQLPDKKLRPHLNMTNVIKEKSEYLKEEK